MKRMDDYMVYMDKKISYVSREELERRYRLPPKFRSIEMEHTLTLPHPSLSDLPLSDAIRGELESLYLDKVVAPVGFCVSISDIHSIVGGVISPEDEDGAATYTVKFSLMMFSPIEGEVIASAKLLESTKEGLRLSLGFFDDIILPRDLLPEECHYVPDPREKDKGFWVWYRNKRYNCPLYIDGRDEIIFKVVSVSYPSPQPEEENNSRGRSARMIVTGSIDGFGLGQLGWWFDLLGGERNA